MKPRVDIMPEVSNQIAVGGEWLRHEHDNKRVYVVTDHNRYNVFYKIKGTDHTGHTSIEYLLSNFEQIR